MKPIGTGFGDDIDGATRPLKLSGVSVGQHFHFLNVIGNDCDNFAAGNCFIIVDAIQEVYTLLRLFWPWIEGGRGCRYSCDRRSGRC